MTRIRPADKTCAVCGTTATYTILTSTNQFGSPDLDTRPAEMRRSTMGLWAQRCETCGYCAGDISSAPAHAAAQVAGAAYQAHLHDPAYPELANRFRCCALLAAAEGDQTKAGWWWLRAAWTCDDADDPGGARVCRLQALAAFGAARAAGVRIFKKPAEDQMLLADLLRRTGQFEQAAALCETALADRPPAQLAAILRFQQQLALAQDSACHRMEEALAAPKK